MRSLKEFTLKVSLGRNLFVILNIIEIKNILT